MKNIEIRKYNKNDYKQVQKICVATADEALLSRPNMEEKVLGCYCNYYIEKEVENCFVAVDDKKVIGYILCAENAEKWTEDFKKYYIEKASTAELKEYYLNSTILPLKFVNDYSAHLHIDILNEYQRMGIGHKLMDNLIAHLRNKGINGLMLVVSSDNEKGIKFYNKFGFNIVEKTEYVVVMGIKLK